MHVFNIKGQLYDFSNPQIMGILNFTPDSFNKNSRVDVSEIRERIAEMFEQGADIIDIGAMSTRPGCTMISEEVEWQRLEPALEVIAKFFPEKIFSLDTFRSQIAYKAVTDYGISIINDISSGAGDLRMFDVIADLHVPYIIMHGAENPAQMHNNDQQFDVYSLIKYFAVKVEKLHQKGISDIIIDPGFGFSKTIEQNYMIMQNLEAFRLLELPLLVGISRKSMIWKHLGTTVEKSLNGTTVLNTIALQKGANILRVHDVREAKEIVKICIFNKPY